DGTRYFAWVDARSGNQEIYVARHSDIGGWESLAGSAEGGGVSATSDASRRPSLALDTSGAPVVAWTEFTASGSDIYVARYDATGNAWTSVGSASNVTDTGAADEVVLRNSTDGLVLAWLDRSNGVANGYLRRFDGSMWSEVAASATGTGVSGSASDVEELRLAVEPGKIAVSWTQQIGSQTQVYVKEYAGVAWSELAGSASANGVSDAITSATDSSIAYWNNQLFVSWSEDDGPAEVPGTQIGVTKFQAGVWSDVTPNALLPTSTATRQARLASGGNQLFLSWTIQPSSHLARTPIYVTRFDGTQFGEELPGDSSGQGVHADAIVPSQFELDVNGLGQPYLAWQDNRPGEKPQVFLRGDRASVDLETRLFVADGTPGKSVSELLAANDFGPGDVILVEGQLGETVTIEAADSGLTIVGGHDSSLGAITVNAADIVIQRLNLGSVIAAGERLTVRESVVSNLAIGGPDTAVVHNELGTVTLALGADGSIVENNQIRSVVLDATDNVLVRHNRIGETSGTGIAIINASGGEIVDNEVVAASVGLALNAPFTGVLEGNQIHGGGIGIRYDAAAALSGNRIFDNQTGVVATVVDLENAFGFVGVTEPNQIFGNAVGVELTGRMQGQWIHGNTTGVIGDGILGGDHINMPNRIEGNTTGVDFDGEVRYNRIGYNGIGILAKPGQLIAHNLLYRNDDVAIQIDAVDDVRVIGNTSYAPAGDNVRLTGGSKRTEIWNNVLWAESGYDISVDLDSQEGYFSDYNVLHASGEGQLVHWVIDFADTLDWQVDVNEFDLHSVGTTVINPEWSEPRFVNRWRDDYEIYDLIGGQRFTSPTIAAGNPMIDAGRSTTAADATIPLTGYDAVNLLSNPSFELGAVDWITNPGSATRDDNPLGYDSGGYFSAGAVAVGEAVQTVDLTTSGVSLAEIDAGDLRVHFGARLRSADESVPDRGRIDLELINGSGAVIKTVAAVSSDTIDRWELVGAVTAIPAGTRSIRFRFTATRNTGTSNDAWMDSAFVRVVHLAHEVNAGVDVSSPAELASDHFPHIAIRFPDLYTDWERDKPKVIRWDSYDNQTDVPIKIDLYQESPDGPVFVTTIVAATPDDGEYVWTPANSGVDYGTHGLIIQVSRSDDPMLFDRSTETFTVPENTTTFYVNDGSQADDQYTTAVGSTRHSGRTPDEPKRLPVNLLRVYSLGPNDTLYIDDGSYAQFEPIYLSGTIGIGDDEGFVLTGPSLAESSINLTHLVPGTDAALITLDDADFVTIQHLDLLNAKHGILAKNQSTGATFSDLNVSGHSSDGIRMESGSSFSVAERIDASNNDGHGIYTTGIATHINDIAAHHNGLSGVTVGGATLYAQDIQVHFNGTSGLVASGTIPAVQRVEANDNGVSGVALALVSDRLSEVQSRRNAASGIAAVAQNGTEVVGNVAEANGGSGIVMTGSGALVQGNTSQGNNQSGIVVPGSSLVYDNTVIGNASNGISISGGGTVVGSSDLSLGRGNIVKDNGANGISAYSATIAGNTVSGHTDGIGISSRGVIARNVVSGNREGIRSVGGASIDGNRIFDHTEYGVFTHGSATVSNNTIYDSRDGVVIEYEYHSAGATATVRNNLIYNQSRQAIRTNTPNDVFENNTVYQTSGDGLVAQGAVGTKARNNIFVVDQGVALSVSSDSLVGFDSDFNLFHVGASGNIGSWNGYDKASLSSWQISSFGDRNSIVSDPLFVDPNGPGNQLGFVNGADDGRDDDFHVMSLVGRFTGSLAPVVDAATGLPQWLPVVEVVDVVQSPAIDRGDTLTTLTNEPATNGGYVNLGAYGNTEQASKSPGDFLFVSTPNGSENWPAARTFTISWRASDVGVGSQSVVNIDLVRDSVTDVTPLLTAGMNLGSYEWTIPESILPADDYRIRVTRVLGGSEIFDESDQPFSITNPISIYYVNDSLDPDDQYAQAAGDDANDGLSPTTPKASIQSILQSYTLEPGDTIVVDHGHYLLNSDITLGASLQGITITGPTSSGSSSVLDRNTGNAIFAFDGADDITISNLTLTNASYGITAPGDSDRIQILNNQIAGNRNDGIYVFQANADQWLIEGNDIFAQPSYG
ncbi:MAG: right-handed parallel beta-helix repeat-containing protein, partial [Planctomycetales bacterium]|nr:right-handed parallel beta-helix repeat-containing protein [Planctomycetales bacterium]